MTIPLDLPGLYTNVSSYSCFSTYLFFNLTKIFRLNHDENREPKVLSEAYCLCRKSRGSSGALCMPIKRDIAVMKRILCDPTTGRYEYVRSLHTITVGCHSVLPRTQRARPLNKFYRSAFTIEI
uniref:Interleukin-17 n=1 Tax=Ascaris lumbricoides TaxID=6252 RepID=A0A0M3IJ72_ASCLU